MTGGRWPAFLRTTHGEFRGETVGVIIRRVYGPRVVFRGSADPGAPEVGLIVKRAGHGPGWVVLAQVWEASAR